MTPDPAESVEARLRAGLPGLIFAVTRCLAAAADAAAAKGAVDDDDAAADADDAAAAREILAPNFARRGEWETQPLAEIAQTAFGSHRAWFENAEKATADAKAARREVRELTARAVALRDLLGDPGDQSSCYDDCRDVVECGTRPRQRHTQHCDEVRAALAALAPPGFAQEPRS